MSGITGENLLVLLERRLDNIVFRLGLAPSRRAARQLVSHKHITVNGNLVNIPSYTLKEGDTIGVRKKSQKLLVIEQSLADEESVRVPWLGWEKNTMTGTFVLAPTREQITENIKEQLIVELYSK